MDPAEVEPLEILARHAYERGRAMRALVAALPVVVIAAIATAVEPAPAVAGTVGAAMFAITWLFLWRGRGLGRGVRPGVAAGMIPFAAMHAARAYGHVCNGAGCFSVCIPASGVGGLAAGLIVGHIARRAGHDDVGRAWVAAVVLAALTGSLACACLGVGGVVGLVAGLVVGSVPLVVRPVPVR